MVDRPVFGCKRTRKAKRGVQGLGNDVTAKIVLVTGASGFLGRPLVNHLLRAGYAVRAAARGSPMFRATVEVVRIPDLSNTIDWTGALDGVDAVVHLAGLAHADSNGVDLPAFDSINWLATQNLALAAKQAGVKNFIFVSSVRAQVGPAADRVVREDDEARPTDQYGRSKLAAETAVRAAGLPFTILRPVAVYGPHPRGNVQTLVRLALLPVPLPLLGVASRRSLLGIDNFISAVQFALGNPATLGEVYLLADTVPFTVSEIFTMLRKAQGRRPGLFYVPPMLLRAGLAISKRDLWQRMSGDLVVDTGKLQALGWRPAVDTYDGIVAMMRAELTR